jgi:hypothetical protein
MKKVFAFLLLTCSMAASQGPAAPYSVTLNWKPSGTATGQNVYRATYASSSGCGPYVVLSNVTGTVATYVDATVVASTSYCYEVTSLNGTVESGPDVNSNNPVVLPPAPPTGLSATVN